ncbi:MAG: hypothetical protein U0441_06925 [Polyangiaceae bacterium]
MRNAESSGAQRTRSSVRNADSLHPSHPSVQLPPPRIPTPPPPVAPRKMELDWECDPGASSRPAETSYDRWVKRGDSLLRQLTQHGAHDHEVRADLELRRFSWIDARGVVSAEARAELLCTFSPQTASVAMGWADARTKAFAPAPIAGMAGEVDGVDEEAAWHLAMAAADHVGADFLYRVRTPSQCLFLALTRLTFAPSLPRFMPNAPIAMVLSTIGEARAAVTLGAEPVDIMRARLSAAGAELLQHAQYTHRDTDWVSRLVRTGRRLRVLADRLPRPTFFTVAKGGGTVWLDRRMADDLAESLALLEDEWRDFGRS